MNRRLMKGWMGSDALTRDLKQPSGRIAGRPAMVVMMDVKSRKSESSFGCSGPAEFPPRPKFARSGCRQRDYFFLDPTSPSRLNFIVLFARKHV
jgi:hypothetical protein